MVMGCGDGDWGTGILGFKNMFFGSTEQRSQ